MTYVKGEDRIRDVTAQLVAVGVDRDRAEWIARNAEAVAEGRAAFLIPWKKGG